MPPQFKRWIPVNLTIYMLASNYHVSFRVIRASWSQFHKQMSQIIWVDRLRLTIGRLASVTVSRWRSADVSCVGGTVNIRFCYPLGREPLDKGRRKSTVAGTSWRAANGRLRKPTPDSLVKNVNNDTLHCRNIEGRRNKFAKIWLWMYDDNREYVSHMESK